MFDQQFEAGAIDSGLERQIADLASHCELVLLLVVQELLPISLLQTISKVNKHEINTL